MDAYVVVPATVLDQGKVSYHAIGLGDFVAEMRIESVFNTAVIEQRMIDSGTDVTRVGQLSKKIEMTRFNQLGESEGRKRIAVTFALIGLICLSILFTARILSAVIEEADRRSAVRPGSLAIDYVQLARFFL